MHTLQRHVALVTLACLLLLLGACSREDRAADPAQATPESGNGQGIVQYTIEPVPLTRSTADANLAISYFPFDERFLFTADQGGNELNHLYVMELDGDETDLTPGASLKAGFMGWAGDDQSFFVQTNERPHITPHEGDVSSAPGAFSPDNRHLLYVTDEGGEFRRLVRFDLSSQQKQDVLTLDWDVMYGSFSREGNYLVAAANVDARTQIYLFDAQTLAPLDAPRVPGEADLGDVVASKQLLIDTGVVAPDRIGIIGGSYGGCMVLAALAFEPEEFAVGVDIFGVANWVRTLENTPPWWGAQRDSLFAEMGDPGIPRSLSQGGRPIVTASKGYYSRAAQDWSGGGATP